MTDPRARTAGQQNHSDPWKYAGEHADAPVDPPASPSLRRAVRRALARAAGRRRKATPWRNCNASLRFVEALNVAYPRRDKASDGTIGDAAHATRSSDHNPWVVVAGKGVVRARDVDKDGIPAAAIVEALRKLGAAGDPRLTGGGYIIFNRRITTPDFKGWKVYTGSNPHDKHFHISFSLRQAGFDSNAPWAIFAGGTTPPATGGAKAGDGVLELGDAGPSVVQLQKVLSRWYPDRAITADGDFGPATLALVKHFQGKAGLTVDGVAGPATLAALGLSGLR